MISLSLSLSSRTSPLYWITRNDKLWDKGVGTSKVYPYAFFHIWSLFKISAFHFLVVGPTNISSIFSGACAAQKQVPLNPKPWPIQH
jgi:hypothetical protein